MAWQYATADSIGTGFRFSLPADSLYVAAGVNIISTDATAVIGNGDSSQVEVFGSISGTTGISWSSTVGVAVTVYAGGTVHGRGSGINVVGEQSKVINHGQVSGSLYTAISAGGNSVRIINTGTVQNYDLTGDFGAAEFFSVSNAVGSEAEFTNFGTVIGMATAVRGDYDFADRFLNHGTVIGNVGQEGGNDFLLNRGTIFGEVRMDRADGDFSGADTFDNRGGTVEGDVFLGAGNDSIDNRGGVIYGTVNGDAGADTFRPGAGIEVFDGGADNDTLDFRGGPAVRVALDDSLVSTGYAADDTYLNFENVTGSELADTIIGSSVDNILLGSGGIDEISGLGGNDTLRGGRGADVLTGGLGNDRFRFGLLNEIGDTVTDFRKIAGDRDRIEVSGANFGGGLVAGTLAASQFQSRADNAAQDADDRFIFRTTDKTLWFDVDGNGSGAAVMVAQFEGAVSLAAGDIIIL